MTFKVGDYVRLIGPNWRPEEKTAVIAETNWDGPTSYRVRVDGFTYSDDPEDGHEADESEIEKIETWATVGDKAIGQLKGSLEEFIEANTRKGGSYYDFPGGVEVRQISAHLTGFGAQALQYVARSTRLDGKNKGDVVSDLRKAIDFITWEIERLQGDAE